MQFGLVNSVKSLKLHPSLVVFSSASFRSRSFALIKGAFTLIFGVVMFFVCCFYEFCISMLSFAISFSS